MDIGGTGNDDVLGLGDLQEEQPVVFTVGWNTGSAPNVIFIGRDGQTAWDSNLLSDYFFIAPGRQLKGVYIRAQADLTLDRVVEGLVSWWKLSVAEPVLALKDNLLDMKTTLLSFNPKSTFYLVDGTIPEEYLGHKGKLYQCDVCGAHVNDHQNLTKIMKH